jgi:hypothetical protein
MSYPSYIFSGLTESTIKNKISLLSQIEKELDIEKGDFRFLLNVKGTYGLINKMYSNKRTAINRFGMLTGIVSNLATRNKRFAEVLPEYQRINKSNGERDKKISEKISEKQKENMISFNEIVELREELFDKATDEDDEEEIDFFDLQDAIILGLYTYIAPVRLDWAEVKVVDKRPEKIEENILVLTPTTAQAFFVEFKTAKTYGLMKTEKFPGVFTNLIHYFQETKKELGLNTEYLLLSKAYTPMTKATLANTIKRIFQTYFGKIISVQMLRHIYLTAHLPKIDVESSKKRASSMGHSLETALRYVF